MNVFAVLQLRSTALSWRVNVEVEKEEHQASTLVIASSPMLLTGFLRLGLPKG